MSSTSERDKLAYKQKLYSGVIKILEERISVNQLAIDSAQLAANEEEKSSAGDKYETSRAMSHIEKDMYSKQLAANKNEMAALLSIDCTKIYTSVKPGSVINAGDFSFFIAAGLGKINFEGGTVYLLSPNAPLAQTLYKKEKGDTLNFTGKDILILDIY